MQNTILLTATNLWKQSNILNKNIQDIRKIPNWERALKENWSEILEELKGSKKAKINPLLSTAVIALISAMGLKAQDIKPDTLTKIIETVKSMPTDTVSQADINEMAKIIPFNIGKTEVELLKNPLSMLFVFKKILENKIENGMDTVKTKIQENPKWAALNKDQLKDLIVKGLMTKIEQPSYKDLKTNLTEYLKDKKEDLSLVEMVASKTVTDYLKKNL